MKCFMDYKSFTSEFDILKNKLFGFINKKNKANIERASDIVDGYLSEIKEGQYSLKSYKAKIIHNELEHTKTKKEFNILIEEINNDTNNLFKLYFEEYLKEVKNELTSPTKEQDIKDYTNSRRKARLDVINKKNALERDSNDKLKELESQLNQKQKEFSDKQSDFRVKLQNEINKLNEKVIKDYSPFETELVEINDKKEANIVKEKIKAIRLNGLNEEYQIKVKSYDEFNQDKKNFINDTNNILYEEEKVKCDKEKKLIEFDAKLKKIDLQLDNHEHNYDAITENKNISNCYEEIDELVRLIKMSNEYIISFNNRDTLDLLYADKIFILDFAVLNLDYILVFVRRNNVYDSLAKIIIDIIAFIRKIKESIVGLIRDENMRHKEYRNNLYEVLKDYDPNSRKVTKEEFLENVLTSLDRYYDNFFNEVFDFVRCAFDYVIMVNNIIRDNLNNLIPLENNNRRLPANFMEESTKYTYINLSEYVGDKYVPAKCALLSPKDELLDDFKEYMKVAYEERKTKITKIMEMLDSEFKQNIESLDNETKEKLALKDDALKDVASKLDLNKLKEEENLKKSISLLKANAKKNLDENIKYL